MLVLYVYEQTQAWYDTWSCIYCDSIVHDFGCFRILFILGVFLLSSFQAAASIGSFG